MEAWVAVGARGLAAGSGIHRSQSGSSMRPISKLRKLVQGQNVVEFALVLPLLLLLMLGLINIGLMVNSQMILTHAAWEGVRVGATLDVVHGEGDAEVVAAIRASLTGLIKPESVEIEIAPTEDERASQAWPGPRGQALSVRLSYAFTASLPLQVELNLEAGAVSRMEYSNPP